MLQLLLVSWIDDWSHCIPQHVPLYDGCIFYRYGKWIYCCEDVMSLW